MATYQNSFYQHSFSGSTPTLKCDKEPVEYKGFLIYQREPDVFDTVENGVCIGMNAGLNGAKKRIDEYVKELESDQTERMLSYAQFHGGF